MVAVSSFFRGRRAVLLTKHKKERVIKPLFEEATGCQVLVEADFDTDLFGTFTRETARTGTQLEAARLKASKGMELHDVDLALASEGSFGPHPVVPFVPLNREIVLLVDAREGLEICGEYVGSETNYEQKLVTNWSEAEQFAMKIGFPDHYLVLRPDHERHTSIIKEIHSWEGLREALEWGLVRSVTGQVYLETDMRAHANQTRMQNIKKAAADLVKKVCQQCPACGAPGFAVAEKKKGLPCEWCGQPTGEVAASVFRCLACAFVKEELAPPGVKAPAGRCFYCNP